MKKNGFTLVELITTFALAAIIIVLLINIIILIKNIYTKSNIEGSLILEQSNISHLINKTFGDNNLKSYISCDESEFCFDFTFNDESTARLIVKDNIIRFNNYTYKIIEGTTIGTPTLKLDFIEIDNEELYNSFLIINIPIQHKLYPNRNFDINIIYQYNSNKISL